MPSSGCGAEDDDQRGRNRGSHDPTTRPFHPIQPSSGEQWADVIRSGANDAGCEAVVAAVNAVTRDRIIANIACVIIALTQILGQVIANANPDIATEVRAGIMRLIDGYAMRAVRENKH